MGDRERPQSKSVRDYFDLQAERWRTIYTENDLHSLFIQQRRERVLHSVDDLGLRPSAAVLDLGCGTGTTVVALARRGYDVTGIDVADAMISQAIQTAKDADLGDRVRLEVGSAYAIEHPDDSFDLVVAMGLVEYLEWDRWAFQEIRRVLKPEGYFILTAPNRYRLAHLARPLSLARSIAKRFYQSRVKKHGIDSSMEIDNRGGFKRRMYWPETLEKKMQSIGFDCLNSETHGFGPLPLIERWKRLSRASNDILQSLADERTLPKLARYGANYNGTFRKLSHPAHVVSRKIFADPGPNRDFEYRFRNAIQSREGWIRSNLISQAPIRAIESEISRGAGILVLSPHPDDEIIGCGGTLLKLIAHGSPVTIVQMTDGGGTRALADEPLHIRKTIRLEEAQVIATELGAQLICFGAEDTTLARRLDLAGRLRTVIEDVRPAVIFTPFVNDPHPDHVATNEILAAALTSTSLDHAQSIYGYEVWSLVPSNVTSNIDAHIEHKERLLLRYRTGMKTTDYVRHCLELGAWNAQRLSGRNGFDERFFARTPAEFLADLQRRRTRAD